VPDRLIQALEAAVGERHVLTDAAMTSGYDVDWTGRFRGRSRAVVRPRDLEQVAAVVGACREAGVAVVPQGGNTGLVGGSVPLAGEVVLSLRRLDWLDPVDALACQVTAGAGTSLAALQRHVDASGLAFGVDLGARDSATVGGMAATNAGGLRLLRYGAMRAQVVGVEAVLSDGTVIRHLGGLTKDNTGYDLAGLLCGSEGTLAVITALRLRLVPRYDERVVALLSFSGVRAALDAVAVLRTTLAALEAAELFFEDGLALVCDQLGLRRPFARAYPVYLLVECADRVDPMPLLAAAVEQLAAEDVAVAADGPRRAELWRYREAHTEAINALGPPVKLDVTLPGAALEAFVGEVREVLRTVCPEGRCYLFGHAADGNLHVNVAGAPAEATEVEDVVLNLVASMGGSISAEHGIGTAKRGWLHLNRSKEEIALFATIKRALDPDGILNPNVLLP